MRVLVDTNILLRSVQPNHPRRQSGDWRSRCVPLYLALDFNDLAKLKGCRCGKRKRDFIPQNARRSDCARKKSARYARNDGMAG